MLFMHYERPGITALLLIFVFFAKNMLTIVNG